MTLKKRNALKRVTKFLSLVSLYRLFSIFLNTIKRNKLNILLTEYRKNRSQQQKYTEILDSKIFGLVCVLNRNLTSMQ